jgi:hypothetical protein
VAAVSVSGPTTRFHGDNLDTLKRHVQKAAREISGALGSPGHVSERSRHDVPIPRGDRATEKERRRRLRQDQGQDPLG